MFQLRRSRGFIFASVILSSLLFVSAPASASVYMESKGGSSSGDSEAKAKEAEAKAKEAEAEAKSKAEAESKKAEEAKKSEEASKKAEEDAKKAEAEAKKAEEAAKKAEEAAKTAAPPVQAPAPEPPPVSAAPAVTTQPEAPKRAEPLVKRPEGDAPPPPRLAATRPLSGTAGLPPRPAGEKGLGALEAAREPAHAPLDHAQRANVFAQQCHLAACELAAASDGVDHGGFARPVGPNQASDLAFLQRQGHTIDGFDAAVVDGHVFGLQYVICHVCLSPA